MKRSEYTKMPNQGPEQATEARQRFLAVSQASGAAKPAALQELTDYQDTVETGALHGVAVAIQGYGEAASGNKRDRRAATKRLTRAQSAADAAYKAAKKSGDRAGSWALQMAKHGSTAQLGDYSAKAANRSAKLCFADASRAFAAITAAYKKATAPGAKEAAIRAFTTLTATDEAGFHAPLPMLRAEAQAALSAGGVRAAQYAAAIVAMGAAIVTMIEQEKKVNQPGPEGEASLRAQMSTARKSERRTPRAAFKDAADLGLSAAAAARTAAKATGKEANKYWKAHKSEAWGGFQGDAELSEACTAQRGAAGTAEWAALEGATRPAPPPPIEAQLAQAATQALLDSPPLKGRIPSPDVEGFAERQARDIAARKAAELLQAEADRKVEAPATPVAATVEVPQPPRKALFGELLKAAPKVHGSGESAPKPDAAPTKAEPKKKPAVKKKPAKGEGPATAEKPTAKTKAAVPPPPAGIPPPPAAAPLQPPPAAAPLQPPPAAAPPQPASVQRRALSSLLGGIQGFDKGKMNKVTTNERRAPLKMDVRNGAGDTKPATAQATGGQQQPRQVEGLVDAVKASGGKDRAGINDRVEAERAERERQRREKEKEGVSWVK